jgi:hypothetical protein
VLEDIPSVEREGPVYRFANQARYVQVLRDMGLSADDIGEMVTLLRDRGLTENEAEVLDGPFAYKPLVKADQTRFSDGSTRVFYSALEVGTAEREVTHGYIKGLLTGTAPVTLFYRYFRASFRGEVKDLRPHIAQWPFLVADDGYDQCNIIGAEASQSGLGGLLSQSARRPEGTTSPVFQRGTLSDVVFEGWRVFRYDPDNHITTISSP